VTRRSWVPAISLAGALIGLPHVVAAHSLSGRVDTSLPLVVYLAGAAIAVALSFGFAFGRAGRWRPGPASPSIQLPVAFIVGARLLGLLAWAWIIVQLLMPGSSDAGVAPLFTWVFGWVGLAIVSALLAPVWEWLDPFATLHDTGAWVLRRLGFRGRRTLPYPTRLGAWPAVAGFAVFVWLELAYTAADMGLVVAVYTMVALTGMACLGRDRWRASGEVFSVWFSLLNRVAPYAPVPRSPGAIRRQRFPDGLLGSPWDASLVSLAAVATGAILYDGLSQTQAYFELFGLPGLATSTLLLAGFLGGIVALVLVVARQVGMAAMGAGLVPIAVGYLIAHYLTYLIGEGQRILVAVSDPLEQGWDLFGTAFHEPTLAWLPTSIVWMVMFLAVVGGHVLGAWAGHQRADAVDTSTGGRAQRARLPLAAIMVVLTTMTLWSLGQALFRPETADPGSTVSVGDPPATVAR
jgi:hypothetical protein